MSDQLGYQSSLEVTLYGQGGEVYSDLLAEEKPLNLWVNGSPYVTLMRTPGDDESLIYGFLKTDKVIEDVDDLESLTPCPTAIDEEGNTRAELICGLSADRVKVILASGVRLNTKARASFVSSSCGLCSLEQLEAQLFKTVSQPMSTRRGWRPSNLSQVTLDAMLARFNRGESLYSLTGGAHAAALFNLQGELLHYSIDVGRHNAVDKVIGSAMIAGVEDFSTYLMLVSSRAGFEIVSKAVSVGISALVTLGAASGAAHRLAILSGLPLYSFTRMGRTHRHQD